MSKITQSLQWRLLITLTLVCLLFSVLVAGFSFYQSYRQAQALQDTKLTNLISLAKSHDLSIENDQIDIELKDTSPQKTTAGAKPAGENGTAIDDLEQAIVSHQTLLYWLDDERLQAYFDPAVLNNLSHQPDGFYEIQGKTGLWRLYLYTQSQTHLPPPSPPTTKKNLHDTKNATSRATSHPSSYALAQPITPPAIKKRRLIIGELLDLRNQLAWQSAKKILFPLLLLIPLLLTVIIFTVHQVFKPLTHITERLRQRLNAVSPHELDSATINPALMSPHNADKLPSEIMPFIDVIQTQMQHLLDSLTLNDRFVSNASHQLRTPMTAILLQAQQLKLPDTATAEQIRAQSYAIDTLLDSIKRNNHLINQLLTLSKSEQKNHTLPAVPFSPSEVITTVLLDFYPIASQKNINLGVAVLQDTVTLPAGTIAELHFKIIVQNLLDNALKYTPIGGRVDISWFNTGEHIYLQVQDSGMGIEEAELAKILEPFYRAYAVTHTTQHTQSSQIPQSLQTSQPLPTVPEGFGLGLAIVNNMVTASHATLTIANHHNLNPNSPYFRADLAAAIPMLPTALSVTLPVPSSDEMSHNLPDTILETVLDPTIHGFDTGLIVQVSWYSLSN